MAPEQWLKIAAVCVLVLGVAAVVVSQARDNSPSPYDSDFDASPDALAQQASQSDEPIPDEAPPGHYQPAPSTAVGMTPEWEEFAAAVDRICGLSYNYTLAREARLRQRSEREGWPDVRWEAASFRLWNTQGTLILRATARLGPPPAEADLYKRWRANVATRRAIRSAAADELDGSGFTPRFSGLLDRLDRFKDQSDEIGQRFGLRICTSN